MLTRSSSDGTIAISSTETSCATRRLGNKKMGIHSGMILNPGSWVILLVEMTKKTTPVEKNPVGRRSDFRPEYVEQAAKYAAVAMDSRPFPGRY
jgi:hypothetical protein